jgi:hypothetical protein
MIEETVMRMKTVLLAMTAILILGACQQEEEREIVPSNTGRDYFVECIDGIEYWKRFSGHMAVRVDSQTLSFVRCDAPQTTLTDQ